MKLCKLLLFSPFLFMSQKQGGLYAQTLIPKFQKVYGGAASDVIHDMKATPDSGYILVGSTESFGGSFPGDRDAYVIKTDAAGNVVWARTFGTNASEEAFSIENAEGGGFFIVGNSVDSTTLNPSIDLLRIDAAGNLIWNKLYSVFPMTYGSVIKKLTPNKYVICGKTYDTTNLNNEAYMLAIDSSGTSLWCRGYNGDVGYDDNARAVTPTSDGGYILSGDSYFIPSHSYNVLAIKTDSTGQAQWINTYASTNNSRGYGAYPEGNGYMLGGQMVRTGAGADLLLIKTDSAGDITWSKTYGGGMIDFVHGFIKQDSSYILIGETQSFSTDGSFDGYIVKTDSGGNLISTKVYGDSLQSEAAICAVAEPHNVLAIGGTTNGSVFGLEDFYFIKTRNDTSGCYQDTTATVVTTVAIGSQTFNNTDTLAATSIPITPLVQAGITDSVLCFAMDTIPADTTIDTTTYVRQLLPDGYKIYPNPSTTEFTLQLPGTSITGYTIKLYNSMGADVTNDFYITPNANRVIFKARSYAPGLYLLSLHDPQGKQVTSRILIE